MPGLFRKKKPSVFISAVIAAAGVGDRMGGIDKQLLPLEGIPVVVRSIGQFCDCPLISEIIVVCRSSDIAEYTHMIKDFGLDKVTSIVSGGGHRQDSVFAGIRACDERAEFFAIHDGARPLVTPEIIEDCLAAALEHGAAAAGVPVKDTIKISDKDGFIAATPDRTSLYAIQTPQIFGAGVYKAAMSLALGGGRYYTDDCQLVEHAGKKVFISQGSYKNIKITTPDDIVLASAMLAFREGDFQ